MSQIFRKLALVVGLFASIQTCSATVATTTLTKDGRNASPAPNTNFGSETFMYVLPAGGGSNIQRSLMGFTTPNNTGTITNVKLFLYLTTKGTQERKKKINLHEITQSGWTEAGFTWNKYDGTNNWTTAGGDYSATIVDAISAPPTTATWYTWEIYGGGADNPVTVNWNTSYNFILKGAAETTGNTDSYRDFASRSTTATSTRPYIEITYTESAPSSPKSGALSKFFRRR